MTVSDIAGLKGEEEAHEACHPVCLPVKQIVWVNIGTFTDVGKYETSLKVRSKDLCWVAYQIIYEEIDNSSHVCLF